MADLVDNVVNEMQNMVSGKSGKKKKGKGKKGDDTLRNLLILGAVAGVGYLIYKKNDTDDRSIIPGSLPGSVTQGPLATEVTTYSLSAGAGGPLVPEQAFQVYF